MFDAFLHRRHRPGVSPEVVAVVLGTEEYWLRVPDTWVLLDIACGYAWGELLPKGLIGDGAQRMADNVADPDHKLTSMNLHVAVQSLGIYLYGWPFYVAHRALRVVRHYESTFRCWALTNVARSMDELSAMDWTAAAMTWQMSMHQKEEDRLSAWAELTVPSRLPLDAPGVNPDWMRTS